jgi:hypothetical protein
MTNEVSRPRQRPRVVRHMTSCVDARIVLEGFVWLRYHMAGQHASATEDNP